MYKVVELSLIHIYLRHRITYICLLGLSFGDIQLSFGDNFLSFGDIPVSYTHLDRVSVPMWGTCLSEPLSIVALVGRYPANWRCVEETA